MFSAGAAFLFGCSSCPARFLSIGLSDFFLLICALFSEVLNRSLFSEIYIANVFSYSKLPFHFCNDTF